MTFVDRRDDHAKLTADDFDDICTSQLYVMNIYSTEGAMMCESGHGPTRGCGCRGGFLRGFIQPQLLLQLAKQPAHGYELIEILDQSGDLVAADPGNVYRVLRGLEEDGFVCSNWDTSGAGPARRVYELTEDGIDYLSACVANLRETCRRLEEFLADYESQFSKEGNSNA